MVNKFTKKTLKFGAIFLLHEAAFTLCILEREGGFVKSFISYIKKLYLSQKNDFPLRYMASIAVHA